MHGRTLLLAALGATVLTACGPQIEAELIAGRTVRIINMDDERIGIAKIVANDADGRAECVDEPGSTLDPERSYTTTFMLCEEVRTVDVHTDRGRREISFE